jgi:hypothetical protein
MIGFIDTLYIHTTRDYRQYSTIAILHTFQFTVTHAPEFSVFTSRIMATDLYLTVTSNHTRCLFFTAFLAIILQLLILQIRLFTLDHCSLLLLLLKRLSLSLYDPSARTPRKTSLYFSGGVFTSQLPSNWCPIVAWVAGMCLPSRCLAVVIHFTILPWHRSRLLLSISFSIYYLGSFLLSTSLQSESIFN